MKHKLLFLGLMALAMSLNPVRGLGQILTFEFSALAGDEVSAESNANDANLAISYISRGSGLTASVNAERFNATSWAETSIDNAVSGNDYMEFTITPNSGYQFSVSSIYIQMQRSSTGPSGIALRSSVDNFTNNLDQEYTISDIATTQNFTFTFSQLNSTTAVTYRIYMWAESTSGSGGIGDGGGNDIIINGNVTLPEPTYHATDFFVSSISSRQIILKWTDAYADVAPTGYLVKASINPELPSAPTDGVQEDDALLIKNIAQGSSLAIFNGLTPNTNYNFAIWSYTNGGSSIDYKNVNQPYTSGQTMELVINEVDSDTPSTDTYEFIELYDGGTGNTDLTGLVIVLFNGSDNSSYNAIDLDSYSTNALGYFVVGNGSVDNVDFVISDGIIQNGADAVAIYQANASDFPNGTAVTTLDLIDALVYDTNDPDDAELLVLLNDVQSQINEDGNGSKDLQSMQRIPNGSGGVRNTSSYGITAPTPGEKNAYDISWDNGASTSSWNDAANWSGDGIPDENTNVTIPSGKATVEIASDETATCNNLTVEGSLTLKSDGYGTGSLIVNGTSTGTINFERYLSGYTNADNGWHFLSLPLSGLTIATSNFNPTTNVDDLYEFDESQDVNNWLNYNGGTFGDADFQLGKGYLVAYSSSGAKTYTGSTIRTTDLTVNLDYTDGKPNAGWNLVGNPFTSAIDWDLVTKSSSVNGSAYVLNSADGTFKSWNGTTGGLTDGIIPANQGFFVLASSASQSITMSAGSAGDQVHSPTTSYKNGAGLAENTFIVTVSSAKGIDNTYVQLRDDATASFDKQIDAYKVFGYGQLTEIYTSDDQTNYSINCLQAELQAKQIRIGIKSAMASQNVLSFEGLTHLLEQYQIVLEDLTTGQNMQVNEGFTYNFTSEEGDNPNRFLLHFGVVGLGEQDQAPSLNAYVYDNRLYVNSTLDQAQLAVYDLQGRLVMQQQLSSNGLSTLPLNLPQGIYVLRAHNSQQARSLKINIQ